MFTSVLLHLQGSQHSQAVIETGVRLARRHAARVRGVSVTDTRQIQALTGACESAACTVTEQHRLTRIEHGHSAARAELSHACLAANLNFDVRRLSGDPFELLPQESRFHDLVVAYLPDEHDKPSFAEDATAWTARELVDLSLCGVQPLLVVRRQSQPLQRVLLVYDGTPAAGRAIRSYVGQGLAPEADHRLLAVGESEHAAREALHNMNDYFQRRRIALETGWICGSPRKVLAPYAQKWNADLIVLGATRTNALVRRVFGETAQNALRRLPAALYLAT